MKAFPWSIDNGETVRGEKGMDLRDYFAAKAMQAFLAGKYNMLLSDLVVKAYATADAMMKAREQ